MKPEQLLLDVSLREHATLDNFFTPANHNNQQVISDIASLISNQSSAEIYIWGATGSGISHLLQGFCYTASDTGKAAQYLPLAELKHLDGAMVLENIEQLDLVCMDDVDQVCNSQQWVQPLFHAFNRLKDNGKLIIFGAHQVQHQLDCPLEDLRSRLNWCTTYQIKSLDDEEKTAWLQFQSQKKGMQLNSEAAHFIVSHYSRDLIKLGEMIDQLDKQSLQAQKKLTIPFIKSVLD